jgi:periplasmic protein TonB
MFNKLVASEGRRKTGFWSPQNVVVSVLLHVVIVMGALAAGVGETTVGRKSQELVEFVEIEEEKAAEPEPEPEPEPPPPTPDPAIPPPVAKGFQTLIPPDEPPPTIAPPNPNEQRVNVEDFSGIGKEGGVAKGVEGGVQQSTVERTAPPDVGTYELHAVEEQPRPTNIADLRRALERNYPPLLRDAGVTGTVQVRFRVLEDGRVDTESITISASTHDQFNDPTLRAVRTLRFRPARVNNRPVRVWVELPIQWTVTRG